MKTNIPKFDDYICVNDSVSLEVKGFDITIVIEYDSDSRPTDFDCYSDRKISDWKNDEWFFGTICVTASRNEIELGHDYLGGTEINFNKTANRTLNKLIEDYGMVENAVSDAQDAIRGLVTGIQSRIEPVPADPADIDGAILEESVMSAGNMENDDKYIDNLNT